MAWSQRPAPKTRAPPLRRARVQMTTVVTTPTEEVGTERETDTVMWSQPGSSLEMAPMGSAERRLEQAFCWRIGGKRKERSVWRKVRALLLMRVKALKQDQKSSNFNFERVRNRWKETLDLTGRASEVRGCNPEAGLATVEGKRVNLCSLSVCFSRYQNQL